jgi:hypothetical protein
MTEAKAPSGGENLAEPKFALGRLVTTAAVHEDEEPLDIAIAIWRHAQGDWGDLDDHDTKVNEDALAQGERLLSCYVLAGTGNQVWVITEADRSVTTVLYPSEY